MCARGSCARSVGASTRRKPTDPLGVAEPAADAPIAGHDSPATSRGWVRSGAVREPAATDPEPRLTVVLGTVMLIDPPVRVKVVVVPVVAALAMPGRATSTRVAPTRAVRPARSVLMGAPFWSDSIPFP